MRCGGLDLYRKRNELREGKYGRCVFFFKLIKTYSEPPFVTFHEKHRPLFRKSPRLNYVQTVGTQTEKYPPFSLESYRISGFPNFFTSINGKTLYGKRFTCVPRGSKVMISRFMWKGKMYVW